MRGNFSTVNSVKKRSGFRPALGLIVLYLLSQAYFRPAHQPFLNPTSTLAPASVLNRLINNGGEDAFVFKNWQKKPIELARGTFTGVNVPIDSVEQILNQTKATVKDPLKTIASRTKDIIESMLSEVKKKLLQDESRFFNEQDFDVEVIVQYNAHKSAIFRIETEPQKKNRIYLNWHSFKNPDFLYIVIRHELTDLTLKRLFPDIDPALRELYTLLLVNIEEFMKLRAEHPIRTKRLLDTYQDLAALNIGLFPRYQKIFNDKSLNNPFALFEDICRMVAQENVYFPQMQRRMQNLVFKDGELDPITVPVTRMRIRQMEQELKEKMKLLGEEELSPLADFTGKLPEGLEIFQSWYGESIQYKLIDENKLYLKISFVDTDNKTKYAHLVLSLNDKLNGVLGSWGKIFGLTYNQWQKKSSRVFSHAHEGIDKERRLAWSNFIRLPLTKIIDKLAQGDASSQKRLKDLATRLFAELEIEGKLSSKTWLSIQRKIGKRPGPGTYYALNKIINDYLDKQFPLLFNGKTNLRHTQVKDLKIWPATENPNLNSSVVTWMLPEINHSSPFFYLAESKTSLAEILTLLEQSAAKIEKLIYQAA